MIFQFWIIFSAPGWQTWWWSKVCNILWWYHKRSVYFCCKCIFHFINPTSNIAQEQNTSIPTIVSEYLFLAVLCMLIYYLWYSVIFCYMNFCFCFTWLICFNQPIKTVGHIFNYPVSKSIYFCDMINLDIFRMVIRSKNILLRFCYASLSLFGLVKENT